jgi:hypothetical protein
VLHRCVASMCCIDVLHRCVASMCCIDVLHRCVASMCCADPFEKSTNSGLTKMADDFTTRILADNPPPPRAIGAAALLSILDDNSVQGKDVPTLGLFGCGYSGKATMTRHIHGDESVLSMTPMMRYLSRAARFCADEAKGERLPTCFVR